MLTAPSAIPNSTREVQEMASEKALRASIEKWKGKMYDKICARAEEVCSLLVQAGFDASIHSFNEMGSEL